MSTDFERQRLEMVRTQIERRGLNDARLLATFRRVPRHAFVPAHLQPYAYEDGPLPIGFGQTISQPYIVALMTSLLHLAGGETVLEIGTGSGYQAAILGRLVREVHTIERQPELAEQARTTLAGLGFQNITVYQQDGSCGLPARAPFHGILVTAAAPRVPPPLLEQLALEGRLIIPVGGPAGQLLEAWQRTRQGFEQNEIAPVAFVPLRGSYGWDEESWMAPLGAKP